MPVLGRLSPFLASTQNAGPDPSNSKAGDCFANGAPQLALSSLTPVEPVFDLAYLSASGYRSIW